ncbi:hypothetical protein AXK11_05710 [Cephaloticoccus primus]|uniref:Signal peptidase I n=1 Tax=Cephaloticoccus primus TaxID=1548207 RepID=A0A139SMW4_9BACT|nr:signal peptidase I [Cephaloticoccus primus]KXU35832.1 hypothetical protein AXK11_05710 [Cephaloticoccus primus]
MFSLFASQNTKMRRSAKQWLELAAKVYHYRRDRLSTDELGRLMTHSAALRQLLREKGGDPMRLKLAIEALESVLRELGGTHYPKTSLVENVEFFLVAAIVILGFRAFFVQPFKIPTNSMWPSYYGMTVDNFTSASDVPGGLSRLWRTATLGAQRREVIAPRTGEVSADFFVSAGGNDLELAYSLKPARSWFILPTTVREYTFYVDGEPVRIQVPQDLQGVDKAMRETLFGGDSGFAEHLRALQRDRAKIERHWLEVYPGVSRAAEVLRVPLGRSVARGERVLSFDILTGDQLLADRVSYHFVRPKVGQGFVFRTRQIDSPVMKDRSGHQLDQYYIKRLTGLPGDTLEIKDYRLYRNGEPITGAAAFEKNAQRIDGYVGYRNSQALSKGKTMTVPPGSFMALGDNSANSQDSRYWGYVPATEVIGRPIFIYYPFTRRTGLAR